MIKAEELEKCESCGMPKVGSKKIHWYPNGIIRPPHAKGLRYVVLDTEEFENLYSELGRRMGVSLDFLVRSAKEIITAFFLDYVLSFSQKIILVIGRNIKSLREKMFEKASAPITDIFWGVFEGTEFEGDKVKITVRNPVYLPLLIGGMAGTFQYLFGCNSTGVDYDYNKEEKLLRVTIWPEKRKLEVKKHIPKPVSISEIKLLPGNIPYKYCSQCGALQDISGDFAYNSEEGSIIEKGTNKRFLIMTAHCHNAILTAIEGQLGKEISVMAMEVEKDYNRSNFPVENLTGTEEDYKNLFIPFFFGLRGWGNAVKVEKEGKKLKVRIDNPFNETMLAGVVGGIYEAIEKIEAQVQWIPNVDGYTVITVSPK